MKVLVTGGLGFLGRSIVGKHLEMGDEVVVVDNLFRSPLRGFESSKVKVIVRDLRDVSWGEVRDVELIYHYAAINGTKYFYDAPRYVFETNVRLTDVVAEYMSKIKYLEKVVYASSSEVYGDISLINGDVVGLGRTECGLRCVSEEFPIFIRNSIGDRASYDVSKLYGETKLAFVGAEVGIPVVVQRLFNVYGEGMDVSEYGQVIPEFIRKAVFDDVVSVLPPGTQVRSFVYVDDAVDGIVLSAEKMNGGVINIGSDDDVIDMLSLARMIVKLVGVEKEVSVSGRRREGDVMYRVPCIGKLRSLGWRKKISLSDGLMRVVKHYLRRWGISW